ncbi:MAG: hypothetical protein WC438_01685 [Candidatus Pacearchaeota archaeon]
MIIELSFAMVGGINFGLERSWNLVREIMSKYPNAVWRKVMGKNKGKYIVEID